MSIKLVNWIRQSSWRMTKAKIQFLVFLLLINLAQAEEQTWTINLKDVDLNTLVTQVADITGRNFILDPRVKGTVTVIATKPMTATEIYDVFLSVLRVHGYTALETGNTIKIIQQTEAKQDNAVYVDQQRQGDQMITRVLPVAYGSADDLVKALRPMVPAYAHLSSIPSANAVVISDYATNVNRIEQLIQRLDKEQYQKAQLEFIQLQHAWVGDLVGVLQKVLVNETGTSSGKTSVHIIANEQTNLIILQGEATARAKVKALIAELDQPDSQINNTAVIRLRHADASDLAKLIKEMLGSDSKKDSDKAELLAKPRILADASLNALVIKAQPAALNEIKELVKQLDVRRAQVLIEAAIVEVSDNSGQQLGVQWVTGSENKSVPAGSISFSNIGVNLNSLLAELAADGTGFNALSLSNGATLAVGKEGGDNQLEFGLLLQALSTVANANLLSTPSVLTLDNQSARIVVGQNVPFLTGSFTNGGAGANNPFTTISREDIGVKLRVTPHIHEGNTLRLDIEQEVSTLVATAAALNAADLITNKRSIETTVLADNDEVIVLGGLIQDDVAETVSKVPILGDFPLIGYLFRGKNTARVKRNLLVFLHPKIIQTGAELVSIGEDRYAGIWDLQLELNDLDTSNLNKELPLSSKGLFGYK